MITRRKAAAIGICVCVALVALARATRSPLLSDHSFSRAAYDRDGNLLRLTLTADQKYRLHAPLNRIPNELEQATLEYEDQYFYEHPGVNPVSLMRAIYSTYLTNGGRRGGSTITMQLARLRFEIESRTVIGKLEQIARALQLEVLYSKQELLEAYLNLAPYGGNVEGVAAAARVWFHKDVGDLNLPEMMALAVMPQSPSRRAPSSNRESEALHEARKKLALVWQTRHLDASLESLALDARLHLHTARELPFLAPHAVERALAADKANELRLTIDGSEQSRIERKVAQYVERRADVGIHNAAVLLIDAETAEVLAHVGSARFFDVSIDGQVDGTSAPRSPGSALKPIVFGRALDEGLIHPRTLLRDLPMRFGAYNPENFDRQFLGPMTATDALLKSRNVPAVDLNQRLKRGLYEVLREVRVRGLREKEHYGAGIVLGGVEVSMEELAELYAALANGGKQKPLRRLRSTDLSPERVLFSPEAAALTLEMLSVEEALLGAWSTPRDAVRVAWKTGTSYAYRDAWTVGVAGSYVLAVWVGNFDGSSNPSFVGRSAAAPLFFDIVDGLRPSMKHFENRLATTQVADAIVCAVSGKRPNTHCPRTTRTRVIPGVSPIESCDVHRLVHLDVHTGLQRCRAIAGQTRDEVFEVWPSDVTKLFAQAGLPRRQLPPLAESCEDDLIDAPPPRILSPQNASTYWLRRTNETQARVPLLAHADGASHSLTWFAGSEFIGIAKRGESLEWSAPHGAHQLRAVDELGRASAVSITVVWID